MKYQIERPKRGAKIIHFPRERIVRVILRDNSVYNPPGPRYPEYEVKDDAPKSA